MSRRRGFAAERLARRLLENMGHIILEVNKRVNIKGSRVAEIDMITTGPDGVKYAVEVKAGKVSVNDIRQAYTNALLIDARPLIIGRGFADSGAKALAEELGVKIIDIKKHYLLLEMDELYSVIHQAIRDVLDEYGVLPLPSRDLLSNRDLEVLKVIALSSSIEEAANKLGVKVNSLSASIRNLRARGILPRTRNYDFLRAVAKNIIDRLTLNELWERIYELLERIDSTLTYTVKILQNIENLIKKNTENH